MLAQDFLETSARVRPDKVALVFRGQRLTYAELDASANQLAHYLLRSGIERGDRVAIFLDNSVELVVAIHATLKAGAVFSAISGSTKTDRLAFVLNHCRARALITHRRKASVVAVTPARVPSILTTVVVGGVSGLDFAATDYDNALAGQPTIAPRRGCIDLDLATIIYTSGSTGLPKGVMSTHLAMTSVSESIADYLENTADDVILSVLPLSFGYGLYQMIVSFRVGGTLILEDGFAFPYRVLQLMQQENVTGFPGAPTMYSLILQIEDLRNMRFPRLRYFTNAAAALPVPHIHRLRQAFPGVRLYSMYGQTECTRVCYLPPEELDRRPDSVGIAIPNTEAYVVDEQGHPVGPGVVGELVVRGGHLMRGYWESPHETARALRPGPIAGETVLYTGDLFRTDDEGYLYFVSRKDDIIKTRGEKVSPKEVETALYDLDGIAEAAVIGLPDPILGRAVTAYVVLRTGHDLSEREILAHCARRLEDFAVPRRVEFWESLPKTDNGKISKSKLRDLVTCAESSAS